MQTKTTNASSKISKQLVTPEKAQCWLENNSKTNRNIKPMAVKRYAQEMRQGNWTETTDTIKFDTRGYLIDGQHRLMAIVESKVALTLYIATNLPEESIQYLDLGTSRSVRDIAKVQGKSYHTSHFSCARNMLFFSNVNLHCLPPHALVKFVDKYYDFIAFAIKNPTSEINFTIKSAQVDGMVARACLNGANKQRLYEFKEVFSTGLPKRGESDYAALCLRKKITEVRDHAKVLKTGGMTYKKTIVEYVQGALSHFLNNKKVTMLKGTTKNLFPVPEIDNLYNDSL